MPTEIGLALVGKMGVMYHFHEYVDPEKLIEDKAAEVSGITNADLMNYGAQNYDWCLNESENSSL